MSRLRLLQVVLVLVLVLTSASTAQPGAPLLASPYAPGREEKSEAARHLSATSTHAGTRTMEAAATGITTRVSVASDGTQGNSTSYAPSISADGRYVAFASGASNLMSGDTNDYTDVFLHDRQTGQTTRASVASDGTQANGGSYGLPSISADGRYVAFVSFASNLVSGDTNGAWDIFLHDRQTGQTTRASVASDGTQANDRSFFPSISADGRYVAFDSFASNLVSGDTNGYTDVFVQVIAPLHVYLPLILRNH